MPSRNVIKTYIPGGYYHIYNRGVEKREIFLDEIDCRIFLHYIRLYLSPINELSKMPDQRRVKRFIKNNLSQEVELLAFALMPNHIHFELKQRGEDGIIKFMHRLMTAYVMYFNNRYTRVGPLFQDKYKASLVDGDSYLVQLSKYIHRNAKDLNHPSINFREYSSYPYYLGEKHGSWIKPKEILSYFSHKNPRSSYKNFVTQALDEDLLTEVLLLDEIE